MPLEMIEIITDTIPGYFRVICPHSLTSPHGPCPNEKCLMKKVCQIGGPARLCKSYPCRHAHEKKTCETEAMGGKCKYEHAAVKSGVKGVHIRSFVHKNDVGPSEWRIRCVLAGLVEAHVQGRYMG